MKSAALKCCYFILVVLVFAACKDGKDKHPELTDNPVYSSEPALKKITDQIKSSPKDASLFFERGRLLRKLNYDTLALKDMKMATVLDSTRAEYYSAVGDLLFEKHDIAGSALWLQKAINLNPTDMRAHLKIAKMFLYIKDYAKGFAELNIVLRKDAYNPEAYFLKGMLYKDMKDTAKAISNFQTVLQVAPEYRDAVIQLGLLFTAKKDPIGLKYLENARKMDTTDVLPLYAKGMYYQDQKDYEQAKAMYKACIIQNRHYVNAYFNMGYILRLQDSTAKAYRQYDIVTKIDPSDPTAWFNRGLCSEIMDSIKKAVSDYQMALRLDSSYKSPKEALQRLKAKK